MCHYHFVYLFQVFFSIYLFLAQLSSFFIQSCTLETRQGKILFQFFMCTKTKSRFSSGKKNFECQFIVSVRCPVVAAGWKTKDI